MLFTKIQWHIIVIAAVILALSVISWIQFAGKAGNLISDRSSEKKEEAVLPGSSEKPDAASRTAADTGTAGALKRKAAVLCGFIDKAVDRVGSKWSVYNKEEFSSVDTRLTYLCTGEISSVQVLSGKNKWLFYKTKTDGDPIGDYEGTNIQTPQEMDKIARTAISVQKRLEDRGIKFVILAAPNKESIYWENMPEKYVHAEKTRTDILVEYLLDKGVNVVSPKKDFLDAHLSTQLYYCYDTHWNQLGAYIAVRDTLAPWGISMPELSDRTFTSKPLQGHYHYHAQDDLSKMVGLREILTDETEYEIDGTVPMEWDAYEREQTTKVLSHFSNEKALNKASVLLVGDSFRSAMIPALREQFADVYVSFRDDYKPEILDEIHPDYLIAEYAERYTKSIGNINFLLE